MLALGEKENWIVQVPTTVIGYALRIVAASFFVFHKKDTADSLTPTVEFAKLMERIGVTPTLSISDRE